ncbi:MAG: AI-2E family transporter [Candidatus Staskawiczbacteria bacterium]|nr:AI-2E family transporter [Candidatus Staskawiczbacteria bacterium]
MEQTLDITWKTIIKVLITGFSLYILFLSRDIVIWLAFALIIALLIEPVVNSLRWLRFPRVIAVILVYTSILGVLGLMVYFAAPIFIFEIDHLSKNIPSYFEKLNPILTNLGVDVAKNFEDFASDLVSTFQESSGSIIKAASVLFGGVTSTVVIFVFAFYISLQEKGPEKVLSLLVPKKYEASVLHIFEKAQFKVASWFGARILACVFVGVTSFVVFFLFNIKYAFILSLISGILTFVPFIGPLITGILAFVFVGTSNSWIVAIYIIIALYAIQAVENNFVTPLLMKKFIDLPPILVLVSLLVGGTLFGILGMIFIVPVFGVIYEFLKEFLQSKKEGSIESALT